MSVSAAQSFKLGLLGVVMSLTTVVSSFWLMLFNGARSLHNKICLWWWGEDGIVKEIDEFGGGDEDGLHLTRWQKELIYAAKAEFGCMSYSAANRVIVGDYLRKICREQNARHVDIVRFLPMAIEGALTPTQFDLQAHEYSGRGVVQTRRATVRLPK